MVFISWGGEPSRKIGAALKDLIGHTVQNAKPWMSSVDIHAGSDWSAEVQTHLQAATFGVVCLTPENLDRPWIHYEAGAIAVQVKGKVCPMVFGMTTDAVRYPLKRFQARSMDEAGAWDLVKAIHGAIDPQLLSQAELKVSFDAHWPRCLAALADVASVVPAPTPPTEYELLRELSQSVRLLKDQIELAAVVPVQEIFKLGQSVERDVQQMVLQETLAHAPWAGRTLGELMKAPSKEAKPKLGPLMGARGVSAMSANAAHDGIGDLSPPPGTTGRDE